MLIVTDFSVAARNAVRYVLSWLTDVGMRCDVLLLNTYVIPRASADQLIRINDELREKSLNDLKDEAGAAGRMLQGDGVRIETMSHMGTLENVVDYLTTAKPIACLAAGSGGGLDAESLKKAHCPVLLVPPGAVYGRVENVAVLKDGKRGEEFNASSPWKALIDGAKIHGTAKTSFEDLRSFAECHRAGLIVLQDGANSLSASRKDAAEEISSKLSIPLLLLG
jgi:nucleotide-binding universal stress UspA family protein